MARKFTSMAASMSETRLYPARPLLAASLAVFRDGEVMLTARAHPPLERVYSLPGGLVEIGETLKDAALRELKEETGVEARIVAFNDYVEFIERDETDKVKRHFVIASFIARWTKGEGLVGPEALDIVWRRPDAAQDLRLTPGLAPLLAGAERLIKAAT